MSQLVAALVGSVAGLGLLVVLGALRGRSSLVGLVARTGRGRTGSARIVLVPSVVAITLFGLVALSHTPKRAVRGLVCAEPVDAEISRAATTADNTTKGLNRMGRSPHSGQKAPDYRGRAYPMPRHGVRSVPSQAWSNRSRCITFDQAAANSCAKVAAPSDEA